MGEKRKSNARLAGAPPPKRRSSAAAISLSENHDHPIDEITAELERNNDRLQSKLRGLKETFLTQNGSSDRVVELEGQIQQLSAEMTALRKEMAQKHTEKAALESENTRLSTKVEELQRHLFERPRGTNSQERNEDFSHIADDESSDLTPSPSNFTFNIAGEHLPDGPPAQLTLEQLSSELQDKVSEFAQEMETLWPQKWKERKSITEIAKLYQEGISNQCLHKKCTKAGNSQWTVDDPRHYACGNCANQARLCFSLRDGEIWLAPLPPDVAESTDPTELLHYVVRTSRKGKLHRDKKIWQLWKLSQTAA